MSTLRAAVAAGGALACTIVAVFTLDRLVTDYERQLERIQAEPDRLTVAVASKELYQGVPITDDDLYITQLEPRYLPEGAYLDREHLVGRIPRERILADEVVRADRLADPDAGIGLNAIIPRGTRAISVEISDGAALAGMLEPGSYVDVLVTVDGEDDKPQTRTLLQATYVLGVNRRLSGESREDAMERRGGGKPAVTLLVSPADAEQVAHASMIGDLRLTLRNGHDDAYRSSEGTITCDLRSSDCPEAAPTPAPAPPKTMDERCVPQDQVLGADKQVRWFTPEGLPCEL